MIKNGLGSEHDIPEYFDKCLSDSVDQSKAMVKECVFIVKYTQNQHLISQVYQICLNFDTQEIQELQNELDNLTMEQFADKSKDLAIFFAMDTFMNNFTARSLNSVFKSFIQCVPNESKDLVKDVWKNLKKLHKN